MSIKIIQRILVCNIFLYISIFNFSILFASTINFNNLYVEMKAIVLEIYNKKLKKRSERKKLIFEHGLLDYRKNVMLFLLFKLFKVFYANLLMDFCSNFIYFIFFL